MDLLPLIESSRFECDASTYASTFNSNVYLAKGNKKMRLLKILLSNNCSLDCSYCPNAWRKGRSITPEKLANAFFALRRQGIVDGAFISSAINGDPETTMDRIIAAGELIRRGFDGYLHLKIMPGVSKDQIKRALEIANRISINAETTSQLRMSELSSKDLRNDIMRRERWISEAVKCRMKSHTTQLIAGIGESDLEIIKSMEMHYRRFRVARVYISPFTPIKNTPMEKCEAESRVRIANLYKVDALIRIYGLGAKQLREILIDDMLPNIDPKILLAEKMDELSKLKPIQIPGIGKKAAELMEKGYSLKDLKLMGFSVKKAAPYVPSQTKLSAFV